jgi:hypothetical protein
MSSVQVTGSAGIANPGHMLSHFDGRRHAFFTASSASPMPSYDDLSTRAGLQECHPVANITRPLIYLKDSKGDMLCQARVVVGRIGFILNSINVVFEWTDITAT